MVFENGVKNIQATAYNGVRTVYKHAGRNPSNFFVGNLEKCGLHKFIPTLSDL